LLTAAAVRLHRDCDPTAIAASLLGRAVAGSGRIYKRDAAASSLTNKIEKDLFDFGNTV
jgi:hypothetical protein